ncbi:MAG: hypothetical protein R3B06_04750 [Kofleriaceae bacterium]
MRDVAFDMETKDPDDVLTLCVLATHPSVRLAAVTVTVTPGIPAQIAVVREVLRRLGVDVPIGARVPRSPAAALSPSTSPGWGRWRRPTPTVTPPRCWRGA